MESSTKIAIINGSWAVVFVVKICYFEKVHLKTVQKLSAVFETVIVWLIHKIENFAKCMRCQDSPNFKNVWDACMIIHDLNSRLWQCVQFWKIFDFEKKIENRSDFEKNNFSSKLFIYKENLKILTLSRGQSMVMFFIFLIIKSVFAFPQLIGKHCTCTNILVKIKIDFHCDFGLRFITISPMARGGKFYG